MKTLALQGEKKGHFRLFLPDPAVGAADRGADGGAGGEKSLTANVDTPVHRGELRRFDGDGAITAAVGKEDHRSRTGSQKIYFNFFPKQCQEMGF